MTLFFVHSESGEDAMTASLAALLKRADLGLTLLSGAGTDRITEPIRWVTTSELVDPTPYLRGGELVLTTGMRLPAGRAGVEAYVARLVAAGVVGLGFGVGLAHQTVPARLVRSARAADLPLVVVDEPTPFIAIGEAVADMRIQAEVRELAEALRAQQSITRAAVTHGPEGVTRRLAALLDGWVIVADIAGRVLHEVPGGISDRENRWRAELGRLRSGHRASAALATPDEHVTVQTLGDSDQVHGFLVTGRVSPPSTAHHSMTNVAAALLSVALGREPDSGGARAARATLMASLAAHPDVIAPLLPALGGPVFDQPAVRVVAVAGPAEVLEVLQAHLETLGTALAYPWTSADGESLVVLGEALDAPAAGLSEPGLVCGWSTALTPTETPRGTREALQALRFAVRSGADSRTFDETGAGSLWTVADADRTSAFAARLLDPLRRYEQQSSVPLRESLHAWLAHHGQYDPAAAALGIHRNTLRYRIRKASALLRCDLDNPTVRMELWFTLGTDAV
jgi:purine catabolism regulator